MQNIDRVIVGAWMPKTMARRMRVAAALEGKSKSALMRDLVQSHLVKLEQQGLSLEIVKGPEQKEGMKE